MTGLALTLMAVADVYLIVQLNPVSRVLMLMVLVFVGWIPLALVITAVCLRPYRVTFIALGVVGAAILATVLLA